MRTTEELVKIDIVNSIVRLTKCNFDKRFGNGTELRQVFYAYRDQTVENLGDTINSKLLKINSMRKKMKLPLLEIPSSTSSTQSTLPDKFRRLERFIEELPLPLEEMGVALDRLTGDFPLPLNPMPHLSLVTSIWFPINGRLSSMLDLLQIYCDKLIEDGHLDGAIIVSEELSVNIYQDKIRIKLMGKLLEKKRTAVAIRIFSKLLDKYYDAEVNFTWDMPYNDERATFIWLEFLAEEIVRQLVYEEGFESALTFARNLPLVDPFSTLLLRIEYAHKIEKVWEYIQRCGVISKRVSKVVRAIKCDVNSSKKTFQSSQRPKLKNTPCRRTSLVFSKSPKETSIKIMGIANELSSACFFHHHADKCMDDINGILKNGTKKIDTTHSDHWLQAPFTFQTQDRIQLRSVSRGFL